jgi:hypothetical protein
MWFVDAEEDIVVHGRINPETHQSLKNHPKGGM